MSEFSSQFLAEEEAHSVSFLRECGQSYLEGYVEPAAQFDAAGSMRTIGQCERKSALLKDVNAHISAELTLMDLAAFGVLAQAGGFSGAPKCCSDQVEVGFSTMQNYLYCLGLQFTAGEEVELGEFTTRWFEHQRNHKADLGLGFDSGLEGFSHIRFDAAQRRLFAMSPYAASAVGRLQERERQLCEELNELRGIIARNAKQRLAGEDAKEMFITRTDIKRSLDIAGEVEEGIRIEPAYSPVQDQPQETVGEAVGVKL